MTKKKTRTILEQIDVLIDELKKNKNIELKNPDGRKEWRLALVERKAEAPYVRLQVSWRTTGNVKWRRLNPGWRTAKRIDGFENKARIIIGQILVGKRASGHELQQLTCGDIFTETKKKMPGRYDYRIY